MMRRSSSGHSTNAAGSASAAPAKPLYKNKSSKKPGAWAEPTPAQIQRSIQDSLLPVEISLEITLDPKSAADTPTPRLPLLECSVNSWQELVELQRVVERLQRPTRSSRDPSSDKVEDTLECMVFGSSAKPELQFSPSAVNSVHSLATTLLLRLQSLGLSVRSLLKDRVLVRLHLDSVAINTRKIVPWHAIVVAPSMTTTASDSPAEWIQRVILPRVRSEQDPLARLRHPQLVSVIGAMLEDHAQSGRIHVVVLRGIPGSGKSSLGREVVAICQARHAKAVVCSADVYFETPRGYHFDVKGIGKAHEMSQRTFREALAGREAAVVVVDNTHTQRWEYEPYEQTAVEQGAQLHILEMYCPDVLTCSRMAQRNSHGVSVAKVQAMYLRWEADDRAIKFDPQFQDPLVLVNPVTRNPLNQYVAYVGLFIDSHTRNEVLSRVGPRHENVIAEHITLFFRPTTQYIRQAPIGRKFKVRVVSVVEDSKGQALQIKLDDRLPLKCHNKIPHVTVSTAEGVSAFYSNELLEDPRATRTPVVDAWEFEATLGIALMVQNRKLVTLASPFHHQIKQPPTAGDSTDDIVSSGSPPMDSLVVLDVAASELLRTGPNETIERILLRHELVWHCSGAQATTHRVVVVRNVEEIGMTFETELIAALHTWLSPAWMSNPLQFDTVLFTKKGEALAPKLETIRQTATRVTVLTTQRSLVMANESISSEGGLSVQRLPCLDGQDLMSRLAPALDASLTRAMDAMGVGPTEAACFTVQTAIEIAEHALVMCGIHDASVERVDAALWTHPSSTVEITTTVAVDCCIEDVVAAIQSCGAVNITAVGAEESHVSIQFQLPTLATQTPTIRWLVSHASDRAMRVGNVQHRLRDALTDDQQEMYSRLACVIEAVLRVNGNLTMAASPATLRLLTERVVLAFFTSEASPDPLSMDEKPVDHRVLWAQIVGCLCFLASWDHDRWRLELDAVIHMVSPTDSAIVHEMASQVSEEVQKAASKVATNGDDLSEKTPSWGRKLAAILLTPLAVQR